MLQATTSNGQALYDLLDSFDLDGLMDFFVERNVEDESEYEALNEYLKVENLMEELAYDDHNDNGELIFDYNDDDYDARPVKKAKRGRPRVCQMIPTIKMMKEFNCTFCQKNCKDKDSLEEHEKTHVKCKN